MDALVAGTAAAVGVGAVSVAAILFFNTKDFDSEYRDANKRIVSKLFQEFCAALEDWDKNKKVITKEEEFGLLHPHIQRLSELAGQFERASRNMMLGKAMIRRIAACVFLGGVFLAGGIAVISLQDPGLVGYSLFGFVGALYIGLLAFAFGKRYLDLVRDIDQKDADVGLGKPIFSPGPSDKKP